MAKVSIVKWSQNVNFFDGSAISGTPKYFENFRFQCNIKIWGWAKKGISVHKNHVLRPLYNIYFCHITIVKWSRINKKTIRKCIFGDIFILGLFPIKFPIVTLKTYHHRKEKSYRGSRDSFGNGMTRGTTWAGVEVAKMKKSAIRIAVILILMWHKSARMGEIMNPYHNFATNVEGSPKTTVLSADPAWMPR